MADPVTGYLPEVYVNGVEGGQADVDPANNIIIDLVKQCWESISRYWIRTRCSVTRWLEVLARMVWRVSHHSCHLIIFGDCLAYFADQCSQKRQQNNIYNARTERVWMDCFRSWQLFLPPNERGTSVGTEVKFSSIWSSRLRTLFGMCLNYLWPFIVYMHKTCCKWWIKRT